MRFVHPDKRQRTAAEDDEGGNFDSSTRLYKLKEHMTLGRHIAKVDLQKQRNDTKVRYGIGRAETVSL